MLGTLPLLDVRCAYLHGDIERDTFIRQFVDYLEIKQGFLCTSSSWQALI